MLNEIETDGISPDEVRATLHGIFLEMPLARSPQLRAFLGYIVEASLAGRGSLLKSYSIATEALGRPVDFDPATDAIVRVEAKRLRQTLSGIYGKPDCSLPIRIDIPVGRYEPTFRRFRPNSCGSPDADGSPVGALGFERLRTSAMQARELIRSEERYRALVQASAAVEWRADAQGRVTDSIGWTERTGQSAQDLRANGWLSCLHPDDRDRTAQVWERGYRTGEKVEMLYRVLHRDGGYRWMLSRGIPIDRDDGSIREWIGTVTDIHDHVCAVETLRASEERMRLAMEAAGLVTWEVDLTTKFVTRSSNSQTVFGVGSGPLSDFVTLIHPEDRPRVAAALEEAMSQGKPFEQTFRLIRPDGRLVPVSGRAGLVRTLPSQPGRFIGIASAG